MCPADRISLTLKGLSVRIETVCLRAGVESDSLAKSEGDLIVQTMAGVGRGMSKNHAVLVMTEDHSLRDKELILTLSVSDMILTLKMLGMILNTTGTILMRNMAGMILAMNMLGMILTVNVQGMIITLNVTGMILSTGMIVMMNVPDMILNVTDMTGRWGMKTAIGRDRETTARDTMKRTTMKKACSTGWMRNIGWTGSGRMRRTLTKSTDLGRTHNQCKNKGSSPQTSEGEAADGGEAGGGEIRGTEEGIDSSMWPPVNPLGLRGGSQAGLEKWKSMSDATDGTSDQNHWWHREWTHQMSWWVVRNSDVLVCWKQEETFQCYLCKRVNTT